MNLPDHGEGLIQATHSNFLCIEQQAQAAARSAAAAAATASQDLDDGQLADPAAVAAAVAGTQTVVMKLDEDIQLNVTPSKSSREVMQRVQQSAQVPSQSVASAATQAALTAAMEAAKKAAQDVAPKDAGEEGLGVPGGGGRGRGRGNGRGRGRGGGQGGENQQVKKKKAKDVINMSRDMAESLLEKFKELKQQREQRQQLQNGEAGGQQQQGRQVEDRVLAGNPKLQFIVALLDQACVSAQEKVVIFSEVGRVWGALRRWNKLDICFAASRQPLS